MFENRPKSRIQHCERLHFDWIKSSLKMPKMANLAKMEKKLNATFSVIFKQCEKVHFERCHYYFSG